MSGLESIASRPSIVPGRVLKSLRIGLTGNIAAGKSEVAKLLEQKDCVIVNADQVTHDLYQNEPALVHQLAAHFGADILEEQGGINRIALGAKVFGPEKAKALTELNAMIRPYLQKALDARMETAIKSGNDAVLAGALIVEWGNQKQFDALWVVIAPDELRQNRLMQRNHLSEAEAKARLNSQMPQMEKAAHGNAIIENSGDLEELAELVERAWQHLKATTYS